MAPVSAAGAGSAQGRKPSLPTKEQSLFKQMFRLYEIKQYKKANKIADQILRAVPDHGETLAMKGLILRALDQRDEAYELARRGLRQDIRSQVAWHILGLLHRHDREYKEAAKAYQQALRLDPNNAQLLRELSPLQAHIRDFEGLLRTREQMLQQRPTLRLNWLGLAVANHLLGRHEEALRVLDAWERIAAKYQLGTEGSNVSEASLAYEYRLRLLEEADMREEALKYAETCIQEGKILDRTFALHTAARIAERIGDHERAHGCYWQLLRRNPSNAEYLEGIVRNDTTGRDVVALYDAVPRELRDSAGEECFTPDEAPVLGCALGALRHLEGSCDEFRKRVKELMHHFLEIAQVPSFARILENFYKDDAKKRVIDEVFLELIGNVPAAVHNEATAIFAAEHCMRVSRDPERAIAFLEQFTDSPECIAAIARIWRSVGAYRRAYEAAERARSLDVRDRALNSLAAEYALLAGIPDRAMELILMFTHDGETPPVQALYNLQVMWFELAYADAALAQGRIDRALKYYTAVLRHFTDFREDEYDFHAYCLRKSTIAAYVDLIRWEDRLHQHEYYQRAVRGAARCYLALHRNRADITARLERLRVHAGAITTSASTNETSTAKRASRRPRTPGWMETDPDGTMLISHAAPLEEAEKLTLPLILKATQPSELSEELLDIIFQVAVESARYALAARAVVAALRGSTTVETLSPMAIRLLVRLSRSIRGSSSAAKLAQAELDAVVKTLHGNNVEKVCHEFFERRGATDLASVTALATATGDKAYLERGVLRLCEAGVHPFLSDFEEAWAVAVTENVSEETRAAMRNWYPFADALSSDPPVDPCVFASRSEDISRP